MPNPRHKVIERVWELLKEGYENPKQELSKYKEAKQLIIDFEKREDIKPYDYVCCKRLKARISQLTHEAITPYKDLQLGYLESIKFNEPLCKIDFLYEMIMLSWWWGGHPTWKQLEIMENLLKSASSHEPYSEVEEREALIYHVKGDLLKEEGRYDLSLEFYKKGLEICERLNGSGFLYNRKLVFRFNISVIYGFKGELDLELQVLTQLIKRQKKSQRPGSGGLGTYRGIIGINYYLRGDLEKANYYFKKSLKDLKQDNLLFLTHSALYHLINLNKHSLELAQEYLDQFSQYNEILKNREYNGWYQLSKAILLKASTRTRDRAEAEKILKNLLENKDVIQWKGLSEELVGFELCEIYLEELRTTNNLEILGEIYPLIERILKWTERTNSYIVQAKIKLLQGQLALLEMNMGDARKYLSQAQQIAETHGIHLLARRVSYEHDKLLEQLDKWESFKEKRVPISDRMDLVSLEETIDLILKKRGINPPELVDEVPVLLLIISEGGIPVLSNPFITEWKIDDGRISNFLRAFNVFSEDIFSKGLDRAIWGDYTLIMEPIDSFSVCYLFKGQSYIAKQKIFQFTQQIQNTTPLLDVLKNFQNTHQRFSSKKDPKSHYQYKLNLILFYLLRFK
ncbi:MAG: tetratricopeptide repeat protein [Promethearchaeota archaeon]|jgi:tetratricopeptide (TPR) repeat protein